MTVFAAECLLKDAGLLIHFKVASQIQHHEIYRLVAEICC
jgi:hypothetical protein